jgi:hypothetical protein
MMNNPLNPNTNVVSILMFWLYVAVGKPLHNLLLIIRYE